MRLLISEYCSWYITVKYWYRNVSIKIYLIEYYSKTINIKILLPGYCYYDIYLGILISDYCPQHITIGIFLSEYYLPYPPVHVKGLLSPWFIGVLLTNIISSGINVTLTSLSFFLRKRAVRPGHWTISAN